jgi:hypothetical protein
MISGLLSRIPYAPEQEISEQEQGNSEEEQGIFAALERSFINAAVCIETSPLPSFIVMARVVRKRDPNDGETKLRVGGCPLLPKYRTSRTA